MAKVWSDSGNYGLGGYVYQPAQPAPQVINSQKAPPKLWDAITQFTQGMGQDMHAAVDKHIPNQYEDPRSAIAKLNDINGAGITHGLTRSVIENRVPTELATFIGQGSASWNKDLAAKAARQLDEGVDPAKVWNEHMIGRMPDGSLFSEIDDSAAKLNLPQDFHNKIAETKGQVGGITQLLKDLTATKKSQVDLFPKELNASMKQLREDKKSLLNDLNQPGGLEYAVRDYDESAKLKYALDHPELTKAYPSLGEDVSVTLGQGRVGGVQGQYGNKSMHINALDAPEGAWNPTSTALHENQHAIQDFEGWARGSNLSRSQQDYFDSLSDDLLTTGGAATIRDWKILSNEAAPYYDVKHIQDLQNITQPKQLFNTQDYLEHSHTLRDQLGPPPRSGSQLKWAQDAGNILARKLEANLSYRGRLALSDAAGDRTIARKMIRSVEGKKTRIGYGKYSAALQTNKERTRVNPEFKRLPDAEKMDLYSRSTGEAQARATQDRMDLNLQQRREKYPLEGGLLSDIPVVQLISRYRAQD